MRRYRITVDQAAIRRDDPNPIHLHDTETNIRLNGSELVIRGTIVFRSDLAGTQDGARVWAETNDLPMLSVVE